MLRACEWRRPCRLNRKGKEAHFQKNDWAEADKPLTLADSQGEKRKRALKVLLASHYNWTRKTKDAVEIRSRIASTVE